MNLHRLAFPLLQTAARRPGLRRPFDALMAPLNPFDEARHVDPYPLYERARRRGPIFRHRATGLWMVLGHQAAIEVLRGPVSVDRGPALRASAPYRHMDPSNVDLLTSGILMQDAPDHGRLRRLIGRAFTPRAIVDLVPKIESVTAELLDDLRNGVDPATGMVDVMAGFAERLPIQVIGELLGIPDEQRDEVKTLSDVAARFVEPFGDFDPVVMDRAIDRLRVILDALATERRAAPRPDLITSLVSASAEDGDRLSQDELIAMLVLLLIAGHETTSGLIGNAVVALARHPEARACLTADPDLAPSAVEELLRFDSPVQVTDRIVTEDFRVGDVTLRVGQLVLVFLGAANRDPAASLDPHRLVLDRPNTRPLAFGHGAHHCIGAALTRLQASIAIPALVRAFPQYRVDESRLVWRRSATLRGPARLPIGPISPRRSTPEAAQQPRRLGAPRGRTALRLR